MCRCSMEKCFYWGRNSKWTCDRAPVNLTLYKSRKSSERKWQGSTSKHLNLQNASKGPGRVWREGHHVTAPQIHCDTIVTTEGHSNSGITHEVTTRSEGQFLLVLGHDLLNRGLMPLRKETQKSQKIIWRAAAVNCGAATTHPSILLMHYEISIQTLLWWVSLTQFSVLLLW